MNPQKLYVCACARQCIHSFQLFLWFFLPAKWATAHTKIRHNYMAHRVDLGNWYWWRQTIDCQMSTITTAYYSVNKTELWKAHDGSVPSLLFIHQMIPLLSHKQNHSIFFSLNNLIKFCSLCLPCISELKPRCNQLCC